MAYLTGRTRALTAHGTLTGTCYQENPVVDSMHHPGDYTRSLSMAIHAFRISFLGMTISGSPGYLGGLYGNPDVDSEPPDNGFMNFNRVYDLKAENSPGYLVNGPGDVPSDAYHAQVNVTSSTLTDSFAIDGDWSISCDVEEVMTFGPSTTDNPLGFPVYGGAVALDPPAESNIVLAEQAKIGGYLTATLTSQGQTVTASVRITATNRPAFTINYGLTMEAITRLKNFTSSLEIKGSVGATVCGVGVTDAGTCGGGARIGSGTVAFAQGVAITATASNDGTDGSQYWYKVDATSTIYPPKKYNLQGVIRALSLPYPTNVDMVLDRDGDQLAQPFTGSAAFGETIVQESYSTGAEVVQIKNPSAVPTGFGAAEKSNFHPVRLWIRPGATGDGYAHSLRTLGEDPLDWRVMMRTFKWDALTMTQTGVQAVDSAPAPANWTAGTNTTLASGLTITRASMTDSTPMSLSSPLTTQAPAGLQGSSFRGVSFAGYAFLRLYLTADAAEQPARITLGGKTWDVTVGTSGYVDIDLCAPTNGTAAVDATDTKWPYASIEPQVVTDGPLWGVTNVTSFGIGNLAVAQVYTLAGIELRRKDHANVSFLAPLTDGKVGEDGDISSAAGWVLREPDQPPSGSITTTTYVRRFLDHDTDGRRAREIEDFTWVHTNDGAGTTNDTFPFTPLWSLVGNTSYPREGVTVVDLLPAPTSGCPNANGDEPLNCWLNSSQPLHYAFGAGAYIGGSGAWTYSFNLNLSGTLTIPAQMLCDSVDWYPDCGDVFGFNGAPAYGDTIELRAAKIMRGEACGIVVDNHSARIWRQTVKLKDSALTNRGTGTTVRITGEYETGLPFALGGTTDTASKGMSASSGVYPSRYRRRTCFAVVNVSSCCGKLFCSDQFYFPFVPQAGDHTLLPLEDWRQIPDVPTEDEEIGSEMTSATAEGGR